MVLVIFGIIQANYGVFILETSNNRHLNLKQFTPSYNTSEGRAVAKPALSDLIPGIKVFTRFR